MLGLGQVGGNGYVAVTGQALLFYRQHLWLIPAQGPSRQRASLLMNPHSMPSPIQRHRFVRSLAHQGSRRRLVMLLTVLALVVAVYVAVLVPFPVSDRLLASAPACLLVICAYRYWAFHLYDRLPAIEYGVAQAFISWSLPLILDSEAAQVLSRSQAASDTLLAVALTLFAFLGVAAIATRVGIHLRPLLQALLPRGLAPRPIGPWYGLLLVAPLAVNWGIPSYVPDDLRAIFVFLGGQVPFLVYATASDASGRSRHLGVTSALLLAAAGLGSGMLETVLRPLIAFVLLRIVRFRNAQWSLVAAIIVAVLVLNPAKHAFRDLAWQTPGTKTFTVGQTLDYWSDAFVLAWTDQGAAASATKGVMSRLNELWIIARTMELTPSTVPHRHLAGWEYVPLAPVPRVAWPDKPNYTQLFNDQFAIEFGFIGRSSTASMTFSMPLISDGFWNLGWYGVLLFALVVGAFAGVLVGIIDVSRWASLAVGMAILVNWHINANLFSQVGGVLQIAVGAGTMVWVLALLSRRFHFL